MRTGLETSTVTPGRTAPVVSRTAPAIVDCAAAVPGKSRSDPRSARPPNRREHPMTSSSLASACFESLYLTYLTYCGAGSTTGGSRGAAAGGTVPPSLKAHKRSPRCDRYRPLPPDMMATYCSPLTTYVETGALAPAPV